jgi:hypothetical protein
VKGEHLRAEQLQKRYEIARETKETARALSHDSGIKIA